MEFDTSWDLNKYKSDYESEEHWQLRRDFMEAHKNKFPEDKLICLAQVFFNVEFMGCRYPAKTMTLIEELSKDVAANHREQRKTKLQRTFVKASDAVGAKLKGVKCYGESLKETDGSQTESKAADVTKHFIQDTIGNRFETSHVSSGLRDNQGVEVTSNYNKFTAVSNNITMDDIRSRRGRFGTVVVFYKAGEHPNCTLQRFIKQWEPIEYKQISQKTPDGMSVTQIYLNGEVVGCGNHINPKGAAFYAAQMVLKELVTTYFTIKIKCAFWGDDVINKDNSNENKTSNEGESNKVSTEVSLDEPLPNENIGNRLLKMMGWSGGGLGKNEQGIIEPIKASCKNDRAGLGSARKSKNKSSGCQPNARSLVEDRQDVERVKQLIRNYKRTDNYNDLVFSSEFSKENRAEFHRLAQRIGLKSRSYGGKNEAKRHLVVSKKIDNWAIISGLIKESDKLFNKYELVRPGELDESDFMTFDS